MNDAEAAIDFRVLRPTCSCADSFIAVLASPLEFATWIQIFRVVAVAETWTNTARKAGGVPYSVHERVHEAERSKR